MKLHTQAECHNRPSNEYYDMFGQLVLLQISYNLSEPQISTEIQLKSPEESRSRQFRTPVLNLPIWPLEQSYIQRHPHPNPNIVSLNCLLRNTIKGLFNMQTTHVHICNKKQYNLIKAVPLDSADPINRPMS